MSTSRLDDFFDPERLGKLWSAGPSAAEAVEAAAAAELPLSPAESGVALVAKLQRALERDLGARSARCEPFLARAGELCAALPDPGARAQLLKLLDGLEDLMETIGLRASPGELTRG